MSTLFGPTLPRGGGVSAGGGGGDILTFSIVVGNSLAGDTSDDCDFLDTGNGAQLAAAITSAIGNNDDVYIRPGTYDFNQPGGPAGPITIPNSTVIRGAGVDHTEIIPVIDDPRAFLFGYYGLLEDITVRCMDDPTGVLVQTTAGCVIGLGYISTCNRVKIEFTNDWQMWAAMSVLVRSAFGFPAAIVGGTADLLECHVIGTKNSDMIGGPPCYSYSNIGAAPSYLALEHCIGFGGDYGLYSGFSDNVVVARHCDFVSPLASTICEISGDTSSIVGCRFIQNGMMGGWVTLLSGNRINFSSNYIEASNGGSGIAAVGLNTSAVACVVSGNYGPGDLIGGAGVQVAVDARAGTSYHIVTGNNFFDIASVAPNNYNDAGVGNVFANNL